jgi:hypothetical protein
VTDLDLTTLRDVYDAQLRTYGSAMTGMEVERDGPLERATAADGAGSGAIVHRDLGGLDGAELDAIAAGSRGVVVKTRAAPGGVATVHSVRTVSRTQWSRRRPPRRYLPSGGR